MVGLSIGFIYLHSSNIPLRHHYEGTSWIVKVFQNKTLSFQSTSPLTTLLFLISFNLVRRAQHSNKRLLESTSFGYKVIPHAFISRCYQKHSIKQPQTSSHFCLDPDLDPTIRAFATVKHTQFIAQLPNSKRYLTCLRSHNIQSRIAKTVRVQRHPHWQRFPAAKVDFGRVTNLPRMFRDWTHLDIAWTTTPCGVSHRDFHLFISLHKHAGDRWHNSTW